MHDPGAAPPLHGTKFDDAPGVIGIAPTELPPLPDSILTDPDSGRLDPRNWFKNPALPFELEIGCGKGTFILEESRARPDTNFLGIEWEGEYYAYSADRLRRVNATNARMLRADATEFLRWRMPPGIVRVIHLYFSDPWPKSKHHKNRVVQDRFLADAWRALIPGGELRIVTDHADYWTWMEERFTRWTAPHTERPAQIPADIPLPPFERLEYTKTSAAGEGELVGTNFERKYRREGRPFHSCTLRKCSEGAPSASSGSHQAT
ncbi:MAG: tRNA (guanosine(46)-N7)-methyltransferase TrmB [Phycisphaeraceae bacterium]|nr:MAG: tRNA (guanosine(46)-N7)-methyltransferase TrmB [Phycisphaeraceae bacterium]